MTRRTGERGLALAPVLIGLLATQAITTALLLRLIARGHVVRTDRSESSPR